MVLGHRDLLTGSPADGVPTLSVLDEEVGAAGRLFSARDVGGHLCKDAVRRLTRRVDGVLGNAGWGIRLFELGKDCGCPRFVSARTEEVARVVSNYRLLLSTRAQRLTRRAKMPQKYNRASGLDILAGRMRAIVLAVDERYPRQTPRRRDTT